MMTDNPFEDRITSDASVREAHKPVSAQTPPPSAADRSIKIGTALLPVEGGGAAEVFTMTFGQETINLLPLKNWSQLDFFKWRVRGILPGTPAGLEVANDHVKMAGETVYLNEPDGPARLEHAFNEWLALENKALEEAKQKAQAKTQEAPAETAVQPLHFEITRDKIGHPHIKCLEGNKTAMDVALNPQGFTALIEQRLMRKPTTLKVSALHNWVELDGELFRLDTGPEGEKQFEEALNQRYLLSAGSGALDVLFFPNPASPTGFDIQFPASPHGIVENRRRHLNEETMELMQDAQKCRVLRPGILVKLAVPDLVFKQKTSDGGEQYLDASLENVVPATSEKGETVNVDLSRPLNTLKLDARQLTYVFNHPAVNRRAKLAEASNLQAAA